MKTLNGEGQLWWSQWVPERWHSIIQNTLWLYLVQFSSYLLPFLTLPYLSRVLSVEHFGQIAYAQSVIWNFVTLTEYGFNLTATRDVSIHRHSPEQLTRITNAVLMAKMILTFTGLAILLIITTLVTRIHAQRPLLLITFVSVFGYALFPMWLYQGLEMMRQVAFRDLAAKFVTFVLLFAFVRSDRDYLWAAVAQSSGLVLAGLVDLISVRRLTKVQFAMPEWSQVRAELRTGFPPFLFNGISAMAYSFSVMFVEWKGQIAQIGYFNAAFRIVSVVRALPGPVSVAVYSRLSYRASQDKNSPIRFVDKYWKVFAAPFFAIAVVVTLLAPWVVPAFLGKKYVPAVVPLQILAWGPLLLAWSQFYSTYYMLPCRYDKAWMRLAITCSVLGNLCLLPALRVTSGGAAIAFSMTIGEAFALLAYGWFYYTHTKGQH